LTTLGKTDAAITQLDQVGRIREIPDPENRAEQIAQDYTSLSFFQREKTLIVANTNQEAATITRKIREKLKAEGTLGYEEVATRLKAKNLSQVQSSFSHYYGEGDVIIPTRSYRGQNLEKGKAYYVTAIEDNQLKLKDISGNEVTANPMKFRKSVYTQEPIALAVGDKLRWTKNDQELKRRNGEEFTVTALEGNIATIEGKNGKRDRLHLQEPLHVNQALVSTTYASQGQTAENVLIAADHRTANQENFYVAISRAKTGLQIYAEDKEQLREKALVSQAKENPLEVVPKNHPEPRYDPEPQTPQPSPEQEGAAIGKRIAARFESRRKKAQPNRGAARQTRTPPAAEFSDPQQQTGSSGNQTSSTRRSNQEPDRATANSAKAFPGLNQDTDRFIEQLQSDAEAVGERRQTGRNVSQPTEPANPSTRAADRQLSQNLDTLTRSNASWEQPTQGGIESNEPDQQRSRTTDQQLSERLTALARGSTNGKSDSQQRINRNWEAVTNTCHSLENLEEKSPEQLWHQYKQEINSRSPVDLTRKVAIQALRDGYSPEDVVKVLAHDPHIQQVKKQQGTEKANNHIQQILRNAQDQVAKHQPQVRQQTQQRKQQRDDELTL
ncbi:MAG: hypothetical protein GVY17_00095, partial [Cyanobacteria bacterium]|jgi:hypothetical protein|nr:hypothetical protein [Cyanobacteria bacterium GSL.Bin21]